MWDFSKHLTSVQPLSNMKLVEISKPSTFNFNSGMQTGVHLTKLGVVWQLPDCFIGPEVQATQLPPRGGVADHILASSSEVGHVHDRAMLVGINGWLEKKLPGGHRSAASLLLQTFKAASQEGNNFLCNAFTDSIRILSKSMPISRLHPRFFFVHWRQNIASCPGFPCQNLSCSFEEIWKKVWEDFACDNKPLWRHSAIHQAPRLTNGSWGRNTLYFR